MKVLVVGANGKIGHQVVTMLEESNTHSVRAFVRKEEQAEELKQKGIEAHLGNLEGSVSDLGEAVKGVDAVVFSAGSGGSTGADKTLLIDLDGAVKVIEAAQNVGVDRFILVSAFGANNRESWIGNEDMAPYYVAKHYADKALEQSNLDYTIVRPGGLLDEPAKDKIKVAENLEVSESDEGTVPREDVAKVIVASLDNEKTYRKAFDLVSGEQAIEEALNQL
ncbi:SDR family oxidoreductase [Desemzia sp. RIT804]|uniref:SDR family oxidoreductase n=1 Tax=Desemzia sp. RIT 804 TaxID=2810209 RepID=UPI001951AAC4|nr:SDR family oxidoreductase [Desemzia sp. RIT 804]MBM6615454.1 SDR family oxidoreductase [Desemzia sp. RIT 804]